MKVPVKALAAIAAVPLFIHSAVHRRLDTRETRSSALAAIRRLEPPELSQIRRARSRELDPIPLGTYPSIPAFSEPVNLDFYRPITYGNLPAPLTPFWGDDAAQYAANNSRWFTADGNKVEPVRRTLADQIADVERSWGRTPTPNGGLPNEALMDGDARMHRPERRAAARQSPARPSFKPLEPLRAIRLTGASEQRSSAFVETKQRDP
ncbi:MAG: hypothetical protein HY059_18840 [Proteobacteria bacterium]|nr:hypothetical protein [Pseudomonadota bacterium]